MKGFNNDEIQKFQKVSEKVFGKSKLSSIKINIKTIGKGLAILGVLSFFWKNYQYQQQQKKRFIDSFALKRQISKKIKLNDFWQKLLKFDFSPDSFATDNYYMSLREGLEELASRYDGKKQIKLTQFSKTKFNFYFLRLHKQDHYLILDKRGNIVKKSLRSPLIIGSLPLWEKKREAMKKKGKKSVIEKMARNKVKLQLENQCDKINVLNTSKMEKQKKLQLLLQCKQKIRPLQKQFIDRLFQREQSQSSFFPVYSEQKQ